MEEFFMFITHYDGRAGEKVEKKVIEAFESFFSTKEVALWFGFLRYPAFYGERENPKGRRESDVIIVERNKGMTVIEVKGLTIENIESIKGQEWNYSNFRESKGHPYEQAEQQLFQLTNKLEENPLLYRRFSKRAWVALPYITKADWEKKGFSELISSPPIIFKDDLENPNKLEKIYSYNIYEEKNPLNDNRWKAMNKFFGLDSSESKSDIQQIVSPQEVNNFSKIYLISSSDNFANIREDIELSLYNGVKVYLLIYGQINSDWREKFYEFENNNNFQLFIYMNYERFPNIKDCVVIDGKDFSEIEPVVKEDFKEFNIEQYYIAHNSAEDNLIVTAGAGTGKTHVMVDRILYLLLVAKVDIKDISMITFTNESKDEMKGRLERKLITLYQLTGKYFFISLAERVKEIEISTIHTFGKGIFGSLTHEFGYGNNFKVRGFIKEKRDIIEKLVDQFFKENASSHSVDRLIDLNIENYKIIEMIMDFWEEMEKRGLSSSEIKVVDWGEVGNQAYQFLQDLFKYVFDKCEERLDELKRSGDTLSINDLVRKMKEVVGDEDKLDQLGRGKFLFVDEFQDSDDVQIELVSVLATRCGYKLFIVGDVKQAIYRFRGADNRSFERLENKLAGLSCKRYSLKNNYRTSSNILERYDNVFSRWGNQNLLPYNRENDQLMANYVSVDECSSLGIRINKYKNKNEQKWELVKEITDSLAYLEENRNLKNKKIAMIVRTNGHARKIESICRENNFAVSTSLEGTFYSSDAVLHFKYLLDGLMYPNEAKYVIRALQTPYFGWVIPYTSLISFWGNSKEILDFVKKDVTEQTYDEEIPNDSFFEHVEALRTLPVMTVIQKIISEHRLIDRLYQYYFDDLEDQTQMTVSQYRKNLYHLMDKIEEKFGFTSNSVFQIQRWLSLQIKTNNKENEPTLDEGTAQIEITTVHRAKGMQYHTVILPEMTRPFGAPDAKKDWDLLIEEYSVEGNTDLSSLKAGWRYKKEISSHYKELELVEIDETEKEETRLLYVAMTRAMEKISFFIPAPPDEDKHTWANLLN
jgi:superfamily I DNA/RNA helicase